MFNSWGRRKAGSRGPLSCPSSPMPSNLPVLQSGCHSGPPAPACLPIPTPARQWGWGRARGANPATGHPSGAAARGPRSCLPCSRQRATVLTELLLTRQAFVRADQRCLSGVLNRIKSCNQTHTHTHKHTQARRSAQPSLPQCQGCCRVARLSRFLTPEPWGSGPPQPQAPA